MTIDLKSNITATSKLCIHNIQPLQYFLYLILFMSKEYARIFLEMIIQPTFKLMRPQFICVRTIP